MPAKLFPCYPFAHPFEEEVSVFLTRNLDSRFFLIHNLVRRNLQVDWMHKEIDLCIMSTNRYLKLVEIKSYKTPPEIYDDSIISSHGDGPNPVSIMEAYGKRLLGLFKERHIKVDVKGYLVLKDKDRNKIRTQWRDQCVKKEELLNILIAESRKRAPSPGFKDQIDTIRQSYLCSSNIQPFTE